MIKDFHGKRYYTDLGDLYQMVINAQKILESLDALKDETFGVTKMDGHWIIYSDSTCETFRGPKYRAWERFKKEIYRLKKES